MLFDDMKTVSSCCISIPLRGATALIAAVGIIYMYLSFAWFKDDWDSLHKMVPFIFTFNMFTYATMLIVLIASVCLMFAVIADNESCILFYLCTIMFHLLCVWLGVIAIFIYCGCIDRNCVEDASFMLIFRVIFMAIVYTGIWLYFFLVVNSYRLKN